LYQLTTQPKRTNTTVNMSTHCTVKQLKKQRATEHDYTITKKPTRFSVTTNSDNTIL